MNLTQLHIEKLEGFFNKIENETYPELPSTLHSEITSKMITHLFDKYSLVKKSRVLDVGCGQGVALELFEENGMSSVGITLNNDDVQACIEKGYDVQYMDQSFLDFSEMEFDLVWCRHCLEHSIFPYFTLSGFYNVLKDSGYLYVEVPAPDTSCRHQTNINHYSVLGKSMWANLMTRCGFTLHEVFDLDFAVPAGPDTYWAFILQK